MKIGFYSQNFVVLKNYWVNLKDQFDCWWGVPEKNLYRKLNDLGEKKISYHEEPHFKNEEIRNRNQFISKDSISFQKKIASEIDPDLWVVDTPNLLNITKEKIPKIQVFHSLPIKKHVFYKPNLEHDLLFLPGEYHKNKFIDIFKLKYNDSRLKIVGWPRVDDLINKKFDRNFVLNKIGLDNKKKTVMYAPSWGWGKGNNNLFCRWNDKELSVFENLCNSVKELNLNFIVRLHSLSFKAENKKLIEIAKKYDVHWQTKETSNYQDDPNESLFVTDILVSDVSGIISEFLVLDRPIIYIDPENEEIWAESDMPKNFRAGQVIKDPNELIEAIKNSVNKPDEFSKERNEIVNKIYANTSGTASQKASQEIINFINKKFI